MKYIETQAPLEEAVQKVAASDWAAVDTEADSLHHYREKLCLFQVSAGSDDFVIDPLASGVDPRPLLQALSQKFLILHGADFDIRLLKRFYGFVPRQIFDTLIASQLLGYEKQGLMDLAQRHCGVILSKSSQKADWSQRPLNQVLLTYAANDTHYLRVISLAMEAELASLGRVEWHRQCCEKLLKSIVTAKEEEPDTRPRWQVKGSKDLSSTALTALKELWHWREEEAERRDRPSFKILHSETLVEIARWADTNRGADIALWPKAPRNVKGEYRDILNSLLQKAAHLPPTRYTEAQSLRPRRKWHPSSQEKLEAMKKVREALGQELKIHPSLLATNAVLEDLAIASPKSIEALEALQCLLPWQAEVLGKNLLEILKK